jgi:hypothetical protein
MAISELVVRVLMAGGAVIIVLGIYVGVGSLRTSFVKHRIKLERRNRKPTQSAEKDTPAPDKSPAQLESEAKRLREASQEMQGQINVRSGMFLGLNGTIIGIFAGLDPSPTVGVFLALAAILMNFLWFMVSYNYYYDIQLLKASHDEAVPDDPVARALRSAGTPDMLKPTTIVARYLPWFGFFGWFAALVMLWPSEWL